MTVISFFCFLICLWIFASYFRHGADVFSPARVFGFIWCLAIGLAELKLSRLQHEWSVESWIQLLIGPVALLVGLFATYVLNLNRRLFPLERMRQILKRQTLNEKRLFDLVVLLFVSFVAAYAIMVFSGRTIPLFSPKPGEARAQFQMFGVAILLHNMSLIVFFSAIYHVMITGFRVKKRLLAALSIVSVIMYAITLQRFLIAFVAILFLTLMYYSTRHLRPAIVGTYIAVGIGFLYAVSAIRLNIVLSYFAFVTSKMKVSPEFAVFTEPYMYTAMCLENFARAIDKLEHHTFGYYTFDFITAIVGMKHWISDYFSLNETPYLESGYNVYSAFWTYYRDFGVIGVCVIGLLGGLGIGKVYYSLRQNPKLSTLSAYSVCVFLMLLSFFNSQTGFLWFVYNITVMYIGLRAIESPQGQWQSAHTYRIS